MELRKKNVQNVNALGGVIESLYFKFMHSLMDTMFKYADFHPNITIIENHKGRIKAKYLLQG